MLLDKLDYVLAVAEEQNITRAAARLYVSQPALTLYLNRLEEDLEVKLFDRSKSPIQITPAGQYYIEMMKKISDSEKLLRDDLHYLTNPSNIFKVGIGHVRGHFWLPIVLPIFCAEFPDMNINVIQSPENQLAEYLKNNQIDLAIGALPALLPGLEVVDFGAEKLLFAAHSSYNLIPKKIRHNYSPRNPYVIKPEILNNLPFIMPAVNNGLHEPFHTIMRENGLHPKRTITLNNHSTGLHLTCCRLGVQLLYFTIVKNDKSQDLSEIDFCVLEKMPTNRKAVAAYRADNEKSSYIKEFVEIIKDEVLTFYDS